MSKKPGVDKWIDKNMPPGIQKKEEKDKITIEKDNLQIVEITYSIVLETADGKVQKLNPVLRWNTFHKIEYEIKED
ncbi:MAG: hypothetical protein QXZ17_05595 [Nitrososphaerota archaeon]